MKKKLVRRLERQVVARTEYGGSIESQVGYQGASPPEKNSARQKSTGAPDSVLNRGSQRVFRCNECGGRAWFMPFYALD
jgi:hypothetical protein